MNNDNTPMRPSLDVILQYAKRNSIQLDAAYDYYYFMEDQNWARNGKDLSNDWRQGLKSYVKSYTQKHNTADNGL